MQAWVRINSVKKISIAYYAWDVWIEDVYGELHGFKVTDSTRYCEQAHPTVLLDVISDTKDRVKLAVPPTLEHGLTEIIVHQRQVHSMLIHGKKARVTYGMSPDTDYKWVQYDEWSSF